MYDPGVQLQRAVYSALMGSADVQAAFGGTPRVFDRVPPYQDGVGQFPYICIGDDQYVDDGTGCFEATLAFVTIHVYSRQVGKPECKRISAAVRQTLTALLPVDGQQTVDGLYQGTQYLTDPDGLTEHGVLTFRYSLEPAE